jgi:ABC-2 type transport system ATP-binding protein
MESTVETGMTVVLSSHLIVDMERVCDHLILLSASRTQVSGAVDELLRAHRVLTGRRRDVGRIAGVAAVVRQTHTDRQTTLFVRTEGAIVDPGWAVEEVALEELVLAYLGSPDSTALPGPRLAATTVGGSE